MPDYLAIGIEVNEIFQVGPDKWRAYAALHRHVYEELKKDHPEASDLRLVHTPRDAQSDRSKPRCDAHSVR